MADGGLGKLDLLISDDCSMTEWFYGSVLYTMTADIKLNFPYILVDIYLSVCLEAVEFKLTQIASN